MLLLCAAAQWAVTEAVRVLEQPAHEQATGSIISTSREDSTLWLTVNNLPALQLSAGALLGGPALSKACQHGCGR